jgi:DNA-binding NtrC family response regulator
VFLPVSTDEKEDAQQIASAGTHRGSETILVLEDDDAVRRVTVRVLRAHGYAVHEAATPSAAREILGLHGAKIDLMLCDVVMPEERGTDFAAAARRTQPSLRVLFMSGYAGTSSTDEIAVPSASSFLDKPFTPDGLAAKLREVLDRQRETP